MQEGCPEEGMAFNQSGQEILPRNKAEEIKLWSPSSEEEAGKKSTEARGDYVQTDQPLRLSTENGGGDPSDEMKRFSSTMETWRNSTRAHILYKRQGPPVSPEKEQMPALQLGNRPTQNRTAATQTQIWGVEGGTPSRASPGTAGSGGRLLWSNRRQSAGVVNSEPTTPPPALTTHPSPGYPSLMLHPSRVRFCWMERKAQGPRHRRSLLAWLWPTAIAHSTSWGHQLGTSSGPTLWN